MLCLVYARQSRRNQRSRVFLRVNSRNWQLRVREKEKKGEKEREKRERERQTDRFPLLLDKKIRTLPSSVTHRSTPQHERPHPLQDARDGSPQEVSPRSVRSKTRHTSKSPSSSDQVGQLSRNTCFSCRGLSCSSLRIRSIYKPGSTWVTRRPIFKPAID